MKYAIPIFLCALTAPAHAHSQQQANTAIDRAIDTQVYWQNKVDEVETAISGISDPTTRAYVEGAWNVFYVTWAGADAAAGSQIDDAMDAYEQQDYGNAVSFANSAWLEFGLLAFRYEIFVMICQGAGWTPPSL